MSESNRPPRLYKVASPNTPRMTSEELRRHPEAIRTIVQRSAQLLDRLRAASARDHYKLTMADVAANAFALGYAYGNHATKIEEDWRRVVIMEPGELANDILLVPPDTDLEEAETAYRDWYHSQYLPSHGTDEALKYIPFERFLVDYYGCKFDPNVETFRERP